MTVTAAPKLRIINAMPPTKAWDDHVNQSESISGDRRSDRRYAISLELRWKLIRRKRVLDSGTGYTLDLSSGGVLFDAGRALPLGFNVELAIVWPVLLHNTSPLQLIVSGRVIRSDYNRVAIQIVQHEFRTLGTSADHRGLLAAAAHTPAALFAKPAAAHGKTQ